MKRILKMIVFILVLLSSAFAQSSRPLPEWAQAIRDEYLNQTIIIRVEPELVGVMGADTLLPWRIAGEISPGRYWNTAGYLAAKYNKTQATVIAVQLTDPLIDIVVRFPDGTVAITSGHGSPGDTRPRYNHAFSLPARFELDERQAREARAAEAERLEAGKSVRIWLEASWSGETVRAGTTGSWLVDCKDDKIDDTRTCDVRSVYPNFVWVVVRKQGSTLSIGVEKFPGMEVAIRVDSLTAVKWPHLSLTPAILQAQRTAILQMTSGKKYLARWYEWPGREEHTYEGSLDGFKEAYQFAQSAVAAYPRPVVLPTYRVTNDRTPGGLKIEP